MVKQNLINIEVVYADDKQQAVIAMEIESNIKVIDAIQRSGILEQFPKINLSRHKVGIFSKMVSLDTILNDGDRIEIYRPLLIDPKQARKHRALKQKKGNG